MSLDDLGNVRVDHVWGNMSMQPNDARGVNVLDPLLDNHQIAYLGWNGYPQYVPNTVGGNAGSGSGGGSGSGSGSGSGGGNVVLIASIPDVWPTLASNSYGIGSGDMYGNATGLSIYLDNNSEWEPAYDAYAGANNYGINFTLNLTVPNGSAFAVRLGQAYDQYMYAWNGPNYLVYDQYSGLNAAQQIENWNSAYAPLLPEFNLGGLRVVDYYGNTASVSGPQGGFLPLEFSDGLNTATNGALVRGGYNGTYSSLTPFMSRNFLSSSDSYQYYFNFMLPAGSDSYGNFPTSSEAALIGASDNYGNFQQVPAAWVVNNYSAYLPLGGSLSITLPAL